jgi:hypothetical protein
MNPGLKYFIRENQHVKREVKHKFTYIDTSWAVPTMRIIDSVEYPKRSPCEKRLGSGRVEVDTGDGGQRVKQQ